MTTNTTRHIAARGNQWSAATINDGWGDNITDDQIAQLVTLVIREFHRIANANDSTAHWTPHTSEVTAYISETTDSETLDEWREEATAHVWDAVIGNPSPLAGKVGVIFVADPTAVLAKVLNIVARIHNLETQHTLTTHDYIRAFNDIAEAVA